MPGTASDLDGSHRSHPAGLELGLEGANFTVFMYFELITQQKKSKVELCDVNQLTHVHGQAFEASEQPDYQGETAEFRECVRLKVLILAYCSVRWSLWLHLCQHGCRSFHSIKLYSWC